MATQPPLNVPVRNWPTPNFDDKLIVERVDNRRGDYRELPKGTAHPRYTDQLLMKQEPVNGGTEILRIYGKQPANQRLYNFAVQYIAGTTAHRIIARSVLVPLNIAFTPTPKLTADPDVATALLVDERQQQLPDDHPYRNSFMLVQRVYEEFATRAQQDAWNGQITYPVANGGMPRIERKYRFPLNAVPALAFETADTVFTGAVLIQKQEAKESDPVVVIAAVFEQFADRAQQDEWNATISQPYGDSAFPRIVRRYRFRKSSFPTVEFGDADTVLTATELIGKELIHEDDVTITFNAIFERVPSPFIKQFAIDEQAKAVIETRRRYIHEAVAAGVVEVPVSPAPTGALVGLEGFSVEIQPVDKWRSIQIASKFVAPPATQSFPTSFSMDVPPVLTKIDWIWAYMISDAFSEDNRWAWSFDINWVLEYPPTPPYDGTLTRYFTKNPSSITVTTTRFEARREVINLNGYGMNGGSPYALAQSREVPRSLHGAITVGWPGSVAAITLDRSPSSLPATSPTTWKGRTIRRVSPPQQYRFGYYVIDVYETEL